MLLLAAATQCDQTRITKGGSMVPFGAIADLRATDFRKGASFGGPFECITTASGNQGPVYPTTVACPYIALKSMEKGK